jgi:hypothetical protein
MLVKTNEKSKTGQDVYENALTGKRAVLSMHDFEPSHRKQLRHRETLIDKVKTNRKRTRGRHIYYQHIDGKTIKHLQ